MHFARLTAGFVASAMILAGGFSTAHAAPDNVTDKLTGLISELSASQQASLLLLLTEMTSKGESAETATAEVSPEEGIQKVLGSMKEALEGQDIDALIALFSDDFFHPQVGGKDEARFILNMGLESGYADGGEVSFEAVEIEKLDDGSYSVYPIDLQSYAGAIAVELVIVQEEDGWAIVTIDADGI